MKTLEHSNFSFLKNSIKFESLIQPTKNIESLFEDKYYIQVAIQSRQIGEALSSLIINFENIQVPEKINFNDKLKLLNKEGILNGNVMEDFYYIKRYGNTSTHNMSIEIDKNLAGILLRKTFNIVKFFYKMYSDDKNIPSFKLPKERIIDYSNTQFETKAERKIIYVWTAKNEDGMWPAYIGSEKVGETTAPNKLRADWTDNSHYLKKVANKRIRQYANTAGVPYDNQWVTLAIKDDEKTWFHDYDVHKVLINSGIQYSKKLQGTEWFETDLKTVKEAIKAVREGREYIDENSRYNINEIKLRPEQEIAVSKTKEIFKNKNRMLWNAKMRFGKTLCALKLIKDLKFKHVLILTHRPVVSDSWSKDFKKMFNPRVEDSLKYRYLSKHSSKLITNFSQEDNFIYFASMQDLRGSEQIGGMQGYKNEAIFSQHWDLVVIDEAHEGTQTELAERVQHAVISKDTKLLELSGTPFNLLQNYEDDQVFTWDYPMEQSAKMNWNIEHPGIPNPYQHLPKVNMFTFQMTQKGTYSRSGSFNFSEFFSVNPNTNEFIYKKDIINFLDEITKKSDTNYPFSTLKFRNNLRHSLWLMPNINAAKALKKLLEKHPIFGKEYKIINIVDKNDHEANENDLSRVRSAISKKPWTTKTITLTVRKLTTGVNIPEWTAVVFLNNTSSPTNYLQSAFRAQTPYSDINGEKNNSYIFDFAPDRALTVMAQASQLRTSPGKRVTNKQKLDMKRLLNFLPIVGISGNKMKPFSVNGMLRKLKSAYAQKAIESGFSDDSLYSDELLLNLNKEDIAAFSDLKSIIGSTTSERMSNVVDINSNGLNESEYDTAEEAKEKSKKDLTAEEKDSLDKLNKAKKNKKAMISILRGISIRIPLMIYGMNVDIEDNIDIEKFVDIVDDVSWKEFMPKGVTKQKFKKFAKYYDPDVFIEAGKRIRRKVQELDYLDTLERVPKLAELFSYFKNPDKETVLTPWRVVNLQLHNTIGGLSFYDDKNYINTTVNNESKINWRYNKIWNKETTFLEINSKTGLYPLYIAASLYYKEFMVLNEKNAGKFNNKEIKNIWRKILKDNIFVIAKTPMAVTITKRTLSGYNDLKTNIKYINNIINNNINQKDMMKSALNKVKKEFNNMKFDVVVGNPPYQEKIGNYNRQVHYKFLQLAYLLSNKSVSIIQPLNWLNDEQTLNMVKNNLVEIHRYSDSTSIFKGVSIPSGVGYTLIDKDKIVSKTNVFEKGKSQKVEVTGNFTLDDIIIMNELGFNEKHHYKNSLYKRVSSYKGHSNKDKSLVEDPSGDVEIWFKKDSGKNGKNKWIKVNRSQIPYGKIIDQYKVMISKDGHAERTETKAENIFNNKAVVLYPGQISTDRPYLLIAKDKKEAVLLAEYANSKFFRRLLHLQDKANSVPKSSFKDVPDISEWIDKFNNYNNNVDCKVNLDDFLNNYYKLSDEVINDINLRIAKK